MAKQKKMSIHKHITQDGRPNGKAYKQHPKAFDRNKGKLVTDEALKGTSFPARILTPKVKKLLGL